MAIPDPRPGLINIKPHMVSMNVDTRPTIKINISSNESALGPGAAVRTAALAAASCMERYAESADSTLSTAIAANYGLDPAGVVCGSGSDDLLARLARAYLRANDELICSVNGYQKIPNYAYANDALPVRADDNEFTANVDQLLSCVTKRTRMVMIANPDNPTGTWLTKAEVKRLHSQLPENVLLVLDSAYYEYVDNHDFEDPVTLVEQHQNVVMTRTFSKIYGLAGIRLGWLYAPPEIASVVRKIGTTFPISNIACDCGLAALTDESYKQHVRDYNARVRTEFIKALHQLGIKVYPSQTNFVLANFESHVLSAVEIYEALVNRGILARRLASAAFADCIRFTIGLEEEMREVANTLRQLLSR